MSKNMLFKAHKIFYMMENMLVNNHSCLITKQEPHLFVVGLNPMNLFVLFTTSTKSPSGKSDFGIPPLFFNR